MVANSSSFSACAGKQFDLGLAAVSDVDSDADKLRDVSKRIADRTDIHVD